MPSDSPAPQHGQPTRGHRRWQRPASGYAVVRQTGSALEERARQECSGLEHPQAWAAPAVCVRSRATTEVVGRRPEVRALPHVSTFEDISTSSWCETESTLRLLYPTKCDKTTTFRRICIYCDRITSDVFLITSCTQQQPRRDVHASRDLHHNWSS